MKFSKTILVTSGDIKGIGLEVFFKAFKKLNYNKKSVKIVLFRSLRSEKKWLKLLPQTGFKTYLSLDEALASDYPLIDLSLNTTPVDWVFKAAQTCMLDIKRFVLVTGPLSKITIKKAGFNYIGHTEILKEVANTNDVFMCFLGSSFSVSLLTGHIPLQNVENKITYLKLKTLVSLVVKLNLRLKNKKSIAIMGLNPHCGDSGIISEFEQKKLNKYYLKLKERFKNLNGLIVPDSAFTPESLKKHAHFICMYHDQGLIPFKLSHGFNSGVHLSLGLPFLRTSVDHGPAQDIFGKNKANCGSMLNALQFAIEF